MLQDFLWYMVLIWIGIVDIIYGVIPTLALFVLKILSINEILNLISLEKNMGLKINIIFLALSSYIFWGYALMILNHKFSQLFKEPVMGVGDIYLIQVMAITLPCKAWPFIGFMSGVFTLIIAGLYVIIKRKKIKSLPLGPMLCSSWIVWRMIASYEDFFSI